MAWRTIGIVGASAEGAALCYRTICTEAAARIGTPYAHPPVALHTHSLADYVERLDRGDLAGVAELMIDSAQRLVRAGAQLLICPDNTIHQAWPSVEPHAPAPWLHIADVVAAAAQRRGLHRLGLMGTRWLVDSQVYPQRLAAHGTRCVRPPADDVEHMHRIIMDELVHGVARPESTQRLQAVVAALAAGACDAVILGCTELPIVLGDHNAALPTLDSTRLLARAAIEHAIGAAPAG